MPSVQTKVVGVTFRDGYPGTFHKWAQLSRDRYPKCTLKRDPDNAVDPNAVKVMVGRRHVGFVPAELTVRVAAVMDDGVPVTARIVSVDVYADMASSPSMTIEITRP